MICPGVEGENLAAAGAGRPARARLGAAAAADRDREAGAGRGRASAAAAPTPPRSCASPPARSTTCRRSRPSSAPTCPSQLDPALALVGGRRRAGRAAARAGARTPPSCCPTAAASAPPRSSPRPTGSASAASPGSWRSSPPQLRAAAGAGASPLAYPELLVNDLEAPARSLRPAIGDALDELREAGAPVALLSGSGPTAVGLFPDLAAAQRRRRGDRSRRRDRLRGGERAVKLPGESGGGVSRKHAADRRRRRRRRLRLLPDQPRARAPRPAGAAGRRLQHARRLDLPARRRLRLRRDRRLRRPRRPRRDGDAARRRRRRPGRDRHLPADRDRLVLGLGRATRPASSSAAGSAASS